MPGIVLKPYYKQIKIWGIIITVLIIIIAPIAIYYYGKSAGKESEKQSRAKLAIERNKKVEVLTQEIELLKKSGDLKEQAMLQYKRELEKGKAASINLSKEIENNFKIQHEEINKNYENRMLIISTMSNYQSCIQLCDRARKRAANDQSFEEFICETDYCNQFRESGN